MNAFQDVFDAWYRLTGNTQFDLARACIIAAILLTVGAAILAGASVRPIVFLTIVIILLWRLPPRWHKSEMGWDPRIPDTSGNAYRGRTWTVIRILAAVVAIAEFGLGAYSGYGGNLRLMWAEFCWGFAALAVMCTLFFSTCNRREVMPAVVS